jgi:PAP2 superfamily
MSSKTRSFYLLPFLLILFHSVWAQTPSPSPKPSPKPTLEKQFFKNVLRDQKAIWTAPFHLRGRDAVWLAPLAGGTAALIVTDQSTGDEIAESRGLLGPSRVISYAGSGYGTGAIALSFYLYGRSQHDYRARETGLLSAEALIDVAITGTTIKTVTQRTRPLSGISRSDFFDGGTSFPSGHSMSAWALATVIANEYHDRPLVKVLAYGVAGAVSVARFTGEKHYLSDVLVGSALGYGIGRYVFHAHHRKQTDADIEEESNERSPVWPSISPRYDRHERQYGATLAWSF